MRGFPELGGGLTAHWDFYFIFSPNSCCTSLEKSKNLTEIVQFSLCLVQESLKHTLGFIFNNQNMSLGGASSLENSKKETKQSYLHYQESSMGDKGVKSSGKAHKILV